MLKLAKIGRLALEKAVQNSRTLSSRVRLLKGYASCVSLLIATIVSLFALTACRLEISFNQKNPAHTMAQSNMSIMPKSTVIDYPTLTPNQTDADPLAELEGTPPTQKTITPSPTPTATDVPATPTPTPTLKPSATLEPNVRVLQVAPTPTPTPIPLLPAQSPPDRIIVPTINLNAPIENVGWSVIKQNGSPVSAWMIPENAVGWHINSALPGHGGNVVLSGHHNLGGEVFRNLVDLKPGDKIIIQAGGRDYHYVVTDHFIVLERGAPDEQRHQNAKWIMPTVDERITMITCWPYVDNSHRLIVVAKPVSNDS